MANLRLTKEEKLREEIIETAQKLFQQYGLHKTTMEDIAKAMGRGKSTLYYYYKSKEEIFEAVVIKEMSDAMNKIKNAIDKVSTAEDKLTTCFLVSNKILKNKINLYRIVRGELNEDSNHINILRKKHNTQEIQIIKDILILGIKNKEFLSDLEKIDVELVSYIIVSSHRSLMLDLVLDDKYPDWDDKLNAMVKILIRGLRK